MAQSNSGSGAPLTLDLGGMNVVLTEGAQLPASHVPGLQSSTPGGAVAEVARHPSLPGVLGLRNLSLATWTVVLPDGRQRSIAPGQSGRLEPGAVFNLGAIQGRVQAGGAPLCTAAPAVPVLPGASTLASSPARSPASPPPGGITPAVCPLCGSPDIQKASAVHSAGAWNSQSHCQPAAGAPYDPNTRHVVTTSGSTVLAQRLAPPQMFTNASVSLVVTVILASTGGIVPCIPFFIGALVVEGLCIHYGSRTYKRWSTLWYCRRCDRAFGPGP